MTLLAHQLECSQVLVLACRLASLSVSDRGKASVPEFPVLARQSFQCAVRLSAPVSAQAVGSGVGSTVSGSSVGSTVVPVCVIVGVGSSEGAGVRVSGVRLAQSAPVCGSTVGSSVGSSCGFRCQSFRYCRLQSLAFALLSAPVSAQAVGSGVRASVTVGSSRRRRLS